MIINNYHDINFNKFFDNNYNSTHTNDQKSIIKLIKYSFSHSLRL